MKLNRAMMMFLLEIFLRDYCGASRIYLFFVTKLLIRIFMVRFFFGAAKLNLHL